MNQVIYSVFNFDDLNYKSILEKINKVSTKNLTKKNIANNIACQKFKNKKLDNCSCEKDRE